MVEPLVTGADDDRANGESTRAAEEFRRAIEHCDDISHRLVAVDRIAPSIPRDERRVFKRSLQVADRRPASPNAVQ
jgi:hypothetical protein